MDRETLKHAETIRRMSGNGMTQRAIAKAVGVSLSTVNRVLNTSPADEPGSLAEMIARSNERRAILEQIYETDNRGEDTAALWAQANAT